MKKYIQSFGKNKVGILFIAVSALCTSWGQYFWKLSLGEELLLLILGFMLYGMGALFMIIAFKFGSFSVLHPMLTLAYISATLIGYFLLDEHIGTNKMIGIACVFIGVLFLGSGDE
jgi:drug/metabolite transporter (DMT)-like permease